MSKREQLRKKVINKYTKLYAQKSNKLQKQKEILSIREEKLFLAEKYKNEFEKIIIDNNLNLSIRSHYTSSNLNNLKNKIDNLEIDVANIDHLLKFANKTNKHLENLNLLFNIRYYWIKDNNSPYYNYNYEIFQKITFPTSISVDKTTDPETYVLTRDFIIDNKLINFEKIHLHIEEITDYIFNSEEDLSLFDKCSEKIQIKLLLDLANLDNIAKQYNYETNFQYYLKDIMKYSKPTTKAYSTAAKLLILK